MPMPAPKETKPWPWVVAGAVLAVILALVAWNYYSVPTVPPSLGLVIVERDGQLQVQWNSTAGPVMQAVRGELNISDGGEKQAFPLAPRDLASGKFVYVRKSGDVEVRMGVTGAGGKLLEEASRFLGRPPEPPKNDQFDALDAKSKQLEAEVKRLRSENAKQQQRIEELDRIRLILQSRLGIK